MSNYKNPKNPKVKITALIACDRCKINNLGERMCPCPRGGCEAEVIGTITTEIKYKLK